MSDRGQLGTALFVAGAAVGGYCLYRAYMGRRLRLPQQWTRVGTLSQLYLYPVKSCKAVTLDRAESSIIGLKSGWLRDRALMVIDETNNGVTARVYPELYSIQPSMNNSELTLAKHNVGSVEVNLAEVLAKSKPQKSTVWGTEVLVYDCGDEVGDWLTKAINRSQKTFRLVYYACQDGRKPPTTSIGKIYNITKNDTGAFSDDTSYNIVNEASVEDLNTRLKDTHVTPYQFRPNFVVTGAKPYDEDNWKFIKIGENVFEVVMPCSRCVMTTLDPETGVRNPDVEPLETLRSYRLVEGEKYRKAVGTSPRMGVQLALRSGSGQAISINDDIYVA